ncbi:hypothetical protein [Vacuolonema iberomarrocanum]|uniref:hypothetical protein n=1 Tax=Vacuolonema iberomarrocanum TaxID=3454632 RepID=UPI003F6E3F35
MQFAHSNSPNQPFSSRSGTHHRPLDLQDHYRCPVCQYGTLSELALMDAFACDFCRHIFTVNLEQQTVQIADGMQPMVWRWDGRNWRSLLSRDQSVTVFIWLLGVGVAIAPPLLVWLSTYTFPPLPGSRWAWFPTVWVSCTLVLHWLLVGWLVAEHYQFPLYVRSKLRLSRAFQRQG